MAFRHLLQRILPRLEGRWVLWAVVILALAGAATLVRWGGAPVPLELVALDPSGQFQDTVSLPAAWADTLTETPDAVARYPLILAVRNPGREPARPDRLALSLPLRYRLAAAGHDLEGDTEFGSPLITYTLEPPFPPLEPGRLPALIPGYDTLWVEVVIPRYYCVPLADSIPDFVTAPPAPVETLGEVRIFYSFEGGDLDTRRTGTLALRLDTTLLSVEMPEQPPSYPMESSPELAQPAMGTLRYAGSRRTLCGEPEDPMELLSTVWETEGGGRFIALDYGGVVRKHLFDLDGDGVIERESWDPDGDGTFEATRRARIPIPAFLLPVRSATGYDLAVFDTLPADSLARLDPFRRAMAGPGTLPEIGDTAAADTARRAGRRAPEDLPTPRVRPAGPLGRPVQIEPVRRPPPDTGGG